MTDKPDHAAALAAAYRQGGRAEAAAYIAEHPEAQGLRMRADVAAVKPRPRAMADARVRAARLMIYSRANLGMTNADIAARISEEIPGYSAPANLLTEPFKPSEKQKVAVMLAECGIALNLAKIKSPSELKAALRAHHAGAGAVDRARVQVVFTEDAVIVGQRCYPISKGAHRRVQTTQGKLNVAALRELLLG